MKEYFIILLLFLNTNLITSQNTVGVLLNTVDALNGYTLFAPMASTETYLINNCGEIINQWSSDYTAGAAVYLLENGNLLRTCKIPNDAINFGGLGGRIEQYDWDNNLVWSYNYTTDLVSQHHDIYPMPNGNILILAVTTITESEAIQMGRDPSKITDGKIYNEQIIEVEPVGTSEGNIVWEWNISDHLIQDFDDTKDNFGVISENPQLLDINFLGIGIGDASWLHVNSIQYNAQLDQIVMSARLLGEIYIIDHSTTTNEAVSNAGGLYEKGGDLLYRWGNPIVYGQGTENDQKLFGQHKPHWIPEGLNDAGKMMIFNNGMARTPSFSELFIIVPPTDSPGVYSYADNTAYGPLIPEYIYIDPVEPTDFYSAIVSNGQRLSNGNTLICEGASGHFFEIDSEDNIVWEYISPVSATGIKSQGEEPSTNTTFRAEKFNLDYPAFVGRDLTPGLQIELNPIPENCQILSVDEERISSILVYPNPVNGILSINSTLKINKIEVYNILGKLIKNNSINSSIDFSDLAPGIYSVKIIHSNGSVSKKIIKE